jgi:hypothetical protein
MDLPNVPFLKALLEQYLSQELPNITAFMRKELSGAIV